MRKPAPSKPPARNQRGSSPRQRKHQHLLDVKVRSRKAIEQRTRRVTNAVCLLILLGAAGAGVWFGGRIAFRKWVVENPDFHVNNIRVATTGTLTREEVLAAAEIHEGMSMFKLNLADARERLTRIPQVEAVEIQRIFPDQAAINLTERRPVAWLAPAGTDDPSTSPDSRLVDRQGVVMQIAHPPSEYLRLPVITGVKLADLPVGEPAELPELQAALDLLRLSEASPVFQVSTIDVANGYCLVATSRSHAQITFGLDRLDQQLERLSLLLDEVGRSQREVRTVNLLVERNVPVTFMDHEPEPPAPVAPSRNNAADAPPPTLDDDMPADAIEMKPTPPPVAKAKVVAAKPVAKPTAPSPSPSGVKTNPFLSGTKSPTPAKTTKPVTKHFQDGTR